MDERQQEFLKALIDCGLSMQVLLAVGAIIQTEASMTLMAQKILEAEDQGKEITDTLVLQMLTDLMNQASVM